MLYCIMPVNYNKKNVNKLFKILQFIHFLDLYLVNTLQFKLLSLVKLVVHTMITSPRLIGHIITIRSSEKLI